MLVEEDKRAKELASKPKIKGGDDEPDWQNVSIQRFYDILVTINEN